jgi:putative transposase
MVPLGNGMCELIPLNRHTLEFLSSDPAMVIRSFTLSESSLSICVSKDVDELEESEVAGTIGVDRNLRNLTVGNDEKVTYYDMSKVVDIVDNTRGIVQSFKRADQRIRQRISSKYGRRRKERVNQLIHAVTKQIVEEAYATKRVIVFEDIGASETYIERKGIGKGVSSGTE